MLWDGTASFHEQLCEMIARGSLDFDTWTSLISETEKTFPDNIETLSLVYDSFLSKFPLCHCYWKRYADHKTRLCTIDKVVEIFERGVQSATHCVGLWVDYCSFGMYAFEDPSDVRRLFRRGISFVGKDYLCHTLWDKFIKFEYSQERWSSLAHIFIEALRFPTKKLHIYYDNLKKFAALMEEEMKCQNNSSIGVESEALPNGVVTMPEDEIYHVIKDLEDPSNSALKSKALKKYLYIGEQFYHKACQLDGKIHCFETHIRRPFFHAKLLDDDQLENWHHYLDFIEKQNDFDWAVKLYERCLIPCANYPEFWMRYVEFVETKGGRELANFALERATQIFLKDVPSIHIFNARFKEKIGDANGARAAFLQCDAESDSYYVENVIKEANMEKRLGNLASASAIYERALEMAGERQKLHTVPILYIHFSRLKYMITRSADVARNVIIDGIQHVPHCRLLLEALINFAMMHEGSRHVNVVDSIVANAIAPEPDESQGLSTKDRGDLSCLYLEFVDLWGTNHDVRKAWNRHIKLFPHLMRTTSSYNHPISSNQLLSEIKEGKQRNFFTMPNQPSEGHGSDHLIELPAEDRVLLPPENHAIQPDLVLTDQYQPNDNDNCAQERMQQLTDQDVVQSREDEAGVNKFTRDLVHQTGDDASGKMESTHGLVHQPREIVSLSMESTHELVHQSQEDASEPLESTYEFEQPELPIRPSEASQEFSNSINAQREEKQDHELEKNLKPVSLETLSLNPLEKESQDFILMVTHEHDVLQEISTSNRSILEGCQNHEENPPTACRNSSPIADSAKLQNEMDENKSVEASHKIPTPTQTHPQPEMLPNSDQLNHMITDSGGASSGFSGHSLDQEHQQCLTAEMGVQVQNGTQGQTQGNITTSHAWAIQNMPQQSSVSASQSQMSPQPAFSHPQAQMPQYPMQSSDQLGHIQHSQTYNNQMLQYHYQHQLMQQQYQQQIMQMQPYIQHQHQQQQPYFQHQQQHQQPYFQQQQCYQVEEQERERQMQQYYQQCQLWLQQQQGYQQMLQQQQYQLPHQQQGQEQQQITLTQNRSHYQQGQGITAPYSTSAPGPSESPHPQQRSPQVVTRPHTAGAPKPVVSPPGGISPSPSAGTSRPASSPPLGHSSPQNQ